MATSTKTRPGTRKLSDVTRKLVAPTGITSTAWPGVEATCRERLGITFDDWQHGAGRLILAKRADGKLAATIGGVGMSVCRQVGKTFLVGGTVFGLCVNRPGTLVIWSAHHGKTHAETFLAMQEFAKRSRIAPYIAAVYVGSGDEEIRFLNGSRILFGARERGFGRGIPGVDVIVSDEAQIMSERAVDAQLATMNTSEFGLALYLGTPPAPGDSSEAFTRMRTEAWAGTLEDAVWIEIGAEPGTDPNDRKQWPVWNPSHPKRTPVESILRLQRKLSEDSFRREGMGTWDEPDSLTVFGEGAWAKGLVPPKEDSQIATRLCYAVAVSVDREWTSIAAAGYRLDGKKHVELIERRKGVAWVADWFTDAEKPHRSAHPIALDGGGPASSVQGALEDEGLDLKILTLKQVLDACGLASDDVKEGRWRHLGQQALDDAVTGAKKRDVGDRFAWGRRKSTCDISPLEAVTLAAYASAPDLTPPPPPMGSLSGSTRAETADLSTASF